MLGYLCRSNLIKVFNTSDTRDTESSEGDTVMQEWLKSYNSVDFKVKRKEP